MDKPLIVAERAARLLLVKHPCEAVFGIEWVCDNPRLNLFKDILDVDPQKIFGEIEKGEHEVELQIQRRETKSNLRVQWMPEPDWLVTEIENTPRRSRGRILPTATHDTGTPSGTRNYLPESPGRLSEIAGSEPTKDGVPGIRSARIENAACRDQGYYDLLLAGSLGRLTDKQRDILEESKDSCERLVRLVSMFLNYSALESGKLVLQLRENDLRDCLDELSKRWSEAFQRKGVRLDASCDPSIPTFRFDYQKVQQAAANLLDNALKHTPNGGIVTLRAAPHFWERRVASMAPVEERRRFRLPRPNSVEVSVTDSGPGIAAEHHQEIFEDFVRVDRNTSGMGLGLAIAKRLIQAHRGKIWVASESQTGSKFTFLLPMDQG